MGRQKYEFRGPKRKERPRKDWVLLNYLFMPQREGCGSRAGVVIAGRLTVPDPRLLPDAHPRSTR